MHRDFILNLLPHPSLVLSTIALMLMPLCPFLAFFDRKLLFLFTGTSHEVSCSAWIRTDQHTSEHLGSCVIFLIVSLRQRWHALCVLPAHQSSTTGIQEEFGRNILGIGEL